MAKVLCLTGMHRSGTSLVASWLEACGLRIHDGNLVGSGIGNPKGHFEDRDFVNLHSSQLRFSRKKSNGWKIFSNEEMRFNDSHLERALTLINTRNQNHYLWGWKDPRTVVFLQQWKQLIPDLKVLLIWRPCYESVQSLLERSRKASSRDSIYHIFPLEAVKLWIYYSKMICRYKENNPNDTVLLSIGYIIHHDFEVIQLISRTLQIELAYSPLSLVLDDSLFRKRTTSSLLRLACSYYQAALLECNLHEHSNT
jgi:hypothetical protein